MAYYAYARMKYRFYQANRRRIPFTILGSRTAPYVRARSLARTFSRLRSSYILHMSGTLISLHSNLSNLSAYTHTFALVLLFHDDKFDSQIYDPQSVLNPT